jgi:hypothetical protein
MKIKAIAETTGQEIVLSSYDVLSVMSQLALGVHKLKEENDIVERENMHKDDEDKEKIPYPEIVHDQLDADEKEGMNYVYTNMQANTSLWYFKSIRNYLDSKKSKK